MTELTDTIIKAVGGLIASDGAAGVPYTGDLGANVQEALDTLAESPGGTVDWDAVTGKPATFPPSPHTQDISTINGLTDALADKATVGAVAAIDTRLTTAETKLSGIQAGATQNQTDAYLLARANHTGVQAQSTVTGLTAALAALQPLNASLTSISGQVNTSYGLALLTLADASAGKAAVGLANADNTSDANKPVSTAQQTALNLKAPLASPAFTGTVSGVTAAMVGLGNVNNTSDANKPVSTAQQTALDAKANLLDTLNAQTGTTYTLQASDLGKIVECANAAAITVTLPNSLVAGFNCIIRQTGAGQVTVAAGASATLTGFTGLKTAGQWAAVTVGVRSNAGSAAIAVLDGGVA